MNTWPRFEEKLRHKYFDEDIKRMLKRGFLNWMEQQLDKYIRPNKLLRQFQKMFE